MKRLIFFVTALVLIIISSQTVLSQNSELNSSVKEAKILIDTAVSLYDFAKMTQALEKFKNIHEADKANPIPLYFLTFAEYKLIEMSFKDKSNEVFDKYYDNAIANCEELSAKKGWESEGKTLQAAVHMMKIAKNSMAAVTLSPKIMGLLEEAEKLNPENPRAYLIHGTMLFNTPKMFGGSYKSAADNFRKSVSIFEKSDMAFTLTPDWGYLDALLWLGRSMAELENFDSAKFYYQKVLSINPRHGWVKYVLMPDLEKKMKENK